VFLKIAVSVVLAAGVGLVGVSVAQPTSGSPGNSATISYPPGEQLSTGSNTLVVPNGSGSVTISWSADCPAPSGDPDPQDWSWSVLIGGKYANGSGAFDTGYMGPPVGSTSWSGQEAFGVSLGSNETSETVNWESELVCGSQDSTLGSGSFTIERCASDDYDTAQREYDTADKLLDKGEEDLKEAANREIEQENKDELAALPIESTLMKNVLTGLEEGEAISPLTAAIAELAHLTNDLLNLAEESILKGEDLDRLTNGAASEFAQAEALADDANQRVGRAFAGDCQDPIHDQVKKLTDQQKLNDKAHSIIDKWKHNEDETIYVNPITGENEQVDYALQQVKAQITGGQHAADMTVREARASSRPKVTVAEVRAAIRYLADAGRVIRKVGGQLAHAEAADESAIEALTALLG